MYSTKRSAVKERLTQIAREELKWKELPQGLLKDTLDSMQMLSLVVAVEDAFEVIFAPEDEASVQSIEDLVTLIMTKLNQ